jgi:hypothetical protein
LKSACDCRDYACIKKQQQVKRGGGGTNTKFVLFHINPSESIRNQAFPTLSWRFRGVLGQLFGAHIAMGINEGQMHDGEAPEHPPSSACRQGTPILGQQAVPHDAALFTFCSQKQSGIQTSLLANIRIDKKSNFGGTASEWTCSTWATSQLSARLNLTNHERNMCLDTA